MALIKCPECNENISDKADICIHCGFPIRDYLLKKQNSVKTYSSQLQYKKMINTYDSYNYGLPQHRREVCPNCGSRNFHAFIDEMIIREGKTKSKTTINLNPLKPFTLFNHKEKVVRKPITQQVSKFVCDDCGKIFN